MELKCHVTLRFAFLNPTTISFEISSVYMEGLFLSIYLQTNFVATQVLTHLFYKFFEKSKNSKKQNPKIEKNNENPKIQKICFFTIFALFLAFSALSQKNLNFQRFFERVRLFTRYFQNYWFFSSRWRWYCLFLEKQFKYRCLLSIWKKMIFFSINREEKTGFWGAILGLKRRGTHKNSNPKSIFFKPAGRPP